MVPYTAYHFNKFYWSASNMDHHVEKTTCNTPGAAVFGVGLIAGTFSALVCKMAYDTESVGMDGQTKFFSKPIMMLLLMFFGMTPAYLMWMAQQSRLPAAERDVVPLRTMLILIIPCFCDLFCTLLLLIAQLYISPSIWQMMRGTVIIISALLKCFVLKHRLQKHMWVGIGVITLAMLLVASTSLFETPTTASNGGKDPRIGVVLVVFGCIAQGVQYVFEEKVMKVDNAPPLVVIGMEGLWGTFLSLFFIYPIAYMLPGSDNGSYESPMDAITMIQNSKMLQVFTITFVLTVTVYNCMAIYVTKYLSAIWHAILDNFRPVTIWGLDLAIFYVIAPNQGFGEAWTAASWLQLFGLLILFLGTAIYNGSMGTWNDEYVVLGAEDDILEQPADTDHSGVQMRTPLVMASPSLTRSPLVYINEVKRKERSNSISNSPGGGYGSLQRRQSGAN